MGSDPNLDILSVLELLQIPLEVALCGGPAEKFPISNLLQLFCFSTCCAMKRKECCSHPRLPPEYPTRLKTREITLVLMPKDENLSTLMMTTTTATMMIECFDHGDKVDVGCWNNVDFFRFLVKQTIEERIHQVHNYIHFVTL